MVPNKTILQKSIYASKSYRIMRPVARAHRIMGFLFNLEKLGPLDLACPALRESEFSGSTWRNAARV